MAVKSSREQTVATIGSIGMLHAHVLQISGQPLIYGMAEILSNEFLGPYEGCSS
jgi:hypothetical protein